MEHVEQIFSMIMHLWNRCLGFCREKKGNVLLMNRCLYSGESTRGSYVQHRVLLPLPLTHAKYYTGLELTCLLEIRDLSQLKNVLFQRCIFNK